MKFWRAPWFSSLLHLIGIAGCVGVPALKAIGMGIPAPVVLGSAAVGGFAAKLSQSPITMQTVAEAVEAATKR